MNHECTSCGRMVARQGALCGPCVNRAMAVAEEATSNAMMIPIVAGVSVGCGLVLAILTLFR